MFIETCRKIGAS